MNNICKLCVHSGIDVKAHPCNDCGDDFSMFKSDIEQQLAAAHRQGWEQAKREAGSLVFYWKNHERALYAIASMEYKEADND